MSFFLYWSRTARATRAGVVRERQGDRRPAREPRISSIDIQWAEFFGGITVALNIPVSPLRFFASLAAAFALASSEI